MMILFCVVVRVSGLGCIVWFVVIRVLSIGWGMCLWLKVIILMFVVKVRMVLIFW